MKKFITRSLIIALIIPLMGILSWYVVSFLPYLKDIKRIAADGNDKVKSINHTLYPLAVAAYTREGIQLSALKQSYWNLVFIKKKKSNSYWHLNNFLWYVIGRTHINENEAFGIWVNCSCFECGKGLPEASVVYYQKKITELSRKELAGLVALVKSPARYKPGTNESEKRIKIILEKTKKS